MQRAWKENCRAGNIKHGSPEAERSMGFLGTQEECVCDGPSKSEESDTGQDCRECRDRSQKDASEGLGFYSKGY